MTDNDPAGTWSRNWDYFDHRPLLRDIAFNKDSINEQTNWHHVSPLAESVNDVGVDGITVRLLQGLPSKTNMAAIMSRALNATTGVDVESPMATGIEGDEWQDLLRGGLQAVMEAFVLVFEVGGVSRACTHQLVRSRRAGFHQQSQRATRYAKPDGLGPNVRVPESVWRKMHEDLELQAAWQRALSYSRIAYELACKADVSYQDARYILPEGTTNYILCEYTLREFLAVYSYRACSMFNWEIVAVVREMGKLLINDSPWVIGTGAEPKISCERTGPNSVTHQMGESVLDVAVEHHEHMCTFQGWEHVEGQCDFEWAKENNRTFIPSASLRIGKADG
jgi:thymidylate synthase (FAD)